MAILEDYYRILQVHFQAEPEVIESAYKRLAKKYHPDVNKAFGADTRMKKINEAYETLHDIGKRRVYDSQRSFRTEPPPRPTSYERPAAHQPPPKPDVETLCPQAAKETLTKYFSCIKLRDFQGAYALISTADKKNISAEDFLKWQSGVARIYNLQEYSFKADKLEGSQRINGCLYQQIVSFSVNTVEHNTVMGRLEKDTLDKKVILEESAWRIFVGFDDINPYIARFEELSALLTAKSAINDMVEHYSFKDSGTGLYNKKGFSDAAQREILRFNRYGNIFSVMLLEVELSKDTHHQKNQELQRFTAAWAGKILNDSFRKLDILARWGETGFIVLLPETTLGSGIKAAKKITAIFDSEPLVFNRKKISFKLNIGLEEFHGSLDETISNLTDYIAVASKSPESSTVYKKSFFSQTAR